MTKFLSLYIKLDRLANHLQSASRALAARVYRIDARLVLARRKRGRVEREPVPFVVTLTGQHKVWSGIIRRAALYEVIVNVKLHLHSLIRLRPVYSPSSHSLLPGLVEPAAKVRIERRVIEADSEDADDYHIRD